MKPIVTFSLMITLAGCNRPTLQEAGELVDWIDRLGARASNALNAREEAKPALPAQGERVTLELACDRGGTMRLDRAWNEGANDKTFTACRVEDWTIDGTWRALEEGGIEAELEVSTSTTVGWSCAMDYRVVALRELALTAAVGTLCGYDWVNDIFCPPGTDDVDGVCAALRAGEYD